MVYGLFLVYDQGRQVTREGGDPGSMVAVGGSLKGQDRGDFVEERERWRRESGKSGGGEGGK